ncbi:MAG: hypothetical protein JO264_00675 [Acidisphaera sp.]|nr:hypothetical protein [Acidisphaera sp.]
MQYLGNNHVGFDPAALGFPSIKGCQAIVYQTQAGIFGFHDMKASGGATADNAKAQAFAAFVQSVAMNHATQALQIYGVINREEQYLDTAGGQTEWRDCLLGVATALNFNGHIYQVRINSHVNKGDSLYVRFDVAGNQSTIRYKRWSKMAYDKTITEVLNNQEEMRKRPATTQQKTDPVLAQQYMDNPQYMTQFPNEQVYPVRRKAKNGNGLLADEGNLNTVSPSAIKTLR